MHELGPGLRRTRRRRPVGGPLVEDLDRLANAREQITPEPHRAGEADPGAAVLAQRPHPLPVPGRHEVQRLLCGVQHAGVLDVDVEHRQVDELGAGLVGRCGDGARQRLLARLRSDRDDLARLDVRAEPDDQVGERANTGLDSVAAHRSGPGCHPCGLHASVRLHASATIPARTGKRASPPAA